MSGARKAVVSVPATSANVGVGYDCLGIALDLRATFTFEESDELVIDGCLEKFRGEDNLAWTSYLEACRRIYREPRPMPHHRLAHPTLGGTGIELHLRSRGRGGGSAAQR